MAACYRPAKYNPPSATTGDTYPGIQFVISFSGEKEDLSRVRIKVMAVGGSFPETTWDSATSGVTIDDASAWTFTWDEIAAIDLDAGYYSIEFETTDAAGGIRTYMTGTWQIYQGISN